MSLYLVLHLGRNLRDTQEESEKGGTIKIHKRIALIGDGTGSKKGQRAGTGNFWLELADVREEAGNQRLWNLQLASFGFVEREKSFPVHKLPRTLVQF